MGNTERDERDERDERPDSGHALDNRDGLDDGNDGHPLDGLSHKQEQAVVALLSEPSIDRAADRAAVGRRTLHRWMTDEKFLRAYRRARREAFAHAISMTQHYAPMAVNALARIVQDGGASWSAKVAAATALLKFGRESIELDDLAGRLDALESRTSGEHAGSGRGSGSWR